jgi:hypothetical protein
MGGLYEAFDECGLISRKPMVANCAGTRLPKRVDAVEKSFCMAERKFSER